VVCSNGWLLDLSDEAPDRPPVPAVDRDPALGGMGLHLVAQLSTDFGWERRPGRKHVWAKLPSGRAEHQHSRRRLPEPRSPELPWLE
jgi:anti-sigma regulatory factor (Ser/Thr protein kinase)